MSDAYAPWLNQAVILQVACNGLRVPLRGTIVGESSDAIRFRLEQSWDVDIFKNMILAIEQDNFSCVAG